MHNFENNGKKILHVGPWNIEGLSNKLDNPDFTSSILKSSI